MPHTTKGESEVKEKKERLYQENNILVQKQCPEYNKIMI